MVSILFTRLITTVHAYMMKFIYETLLSCWSADHAGTRVIADEWISQNLRQLAGSKRQVSCSTTSQCTNTFLYTLFPLLHQNIPANRHFTGQMQNNW